MTGSSAAVRAALDDGDVDRLDDLLENCELTVLPVGLLNDLLVSDSHHWHQLVARALQKVHDPTTVEFVAASLERGFSRLAYTASDDSVIAKWHSWVLAEIGTPDAIQVLRDHAGSDNEEVANAMAYRLARLGVTR